MPLISHKFVLYAPNVHTGGGSVLLRALLDAWPGNVPLTAFLDSRACGHLVLPTNAAVSWVATSIGSRLKAEYELRAALKANPTSMVLCFHGLPPLLASASKVIVFLQNRLYLEPSLALKYRWKTRLRLTVERFLSYAFRHRVSQYIVQTPSMRRAVVHWLAQRGGGHIADVIVTPFLDVLPVTNTIAKTAPQWDFVYVADGEAHKNHRVLLAAWHLLAREGLYPSLALTLGTRDLALANQLETDSVATGLHITNVGHLPHKDVLMLYASTRALIFPSISESFGLPLVEAAHLGLPILAAELDFVRDVCVPAQTFDAASPVSIARAVKRFMGKSEAPLTLRTPAEFCKKLLQDGSSDRTLV